MNTTNKIIENEKEKAELEKRLSTLNEDSIALKNIRIEQIERNFNLFLRNHGLVVKNDKITNRVCIYDKLTGDCLLALADYVAGPTPDHHWYQKQVKNFAEIEQVTAPTAVADHGYGDSLKGSGGYTAISKILTEYDDAHITFTICQDIDKDPKFYIINGRCSRGFDSLLQMSYFFTEKESDMPNVYALSFALKNGGVLQFKDGFFCCFGQKALNLHSLSVNVDKAIIEKQSRIGSHIGVFEYIDDICGKNLNLDFLSGGKQFVESVMEYRECQDENKKEPENGPTEAAKKPEVAMRTDAFRGLEDALKIASKDGSVVAYDRHIDFFGFFRADGRSWACGSKSLIDLSIILGGADLGQSQTLKNLESAIKAGNKLSYQNKDSSYGFLCGGFLEKSLIELDRAIRDC